MYIERLISDVRRILGRLVGMSNEFYILDAASHMERAIEAMEAGHRDPELWRKEQLEIARVFQRLVPFAVRVRTQSSPTDRLLFRGDAYMSGAGCGLHRSKSVYF